MVTKTRLASLTLDRFRGASQRVTIPFSDKAITLLFGENGAGKSSVVDGLEFVLKGTAGSIEDISGATTSSHLSSLNTKAKDIFAEAKLGDGSTFSAVVSGNKITPKGNGSSPCPKATFLRRSKVLNLITAQPKERYEALASFIDVFGVEAAEESLAGALKDQKRSLESAKAKIRTATEELRRLFSEHAVENEKTLGHEQWAAQQASQDIANIKSAVDSLGNVLRDYASANDALTEANNQQGLLDRKREEQKNAQAALEQAIKKAPGAVDLLIDLLNSGKAYVKAVEEIEKCPLCSNATRRSLLIAEIEAKLGALPDVQAAKKARDDANTAVEQQKEKTCDSFVRLLGAANSLFVAIKKIGDDRRIGLNPDAPEFSPLKALPNLNAIAKNHVTKESIESAKILLSRSADLLSKWKAEHDKLEPQKVLLSSIQTHHNALLDGKKEASTLQKVHDHLQAMLDAIRPIRQEFVQATLASVATDCDRLYGEIHPDEQLGGIRLMLDTAKRASCNISADFCGKKEIPPQAYYSESHMDTLGFTLFLALAKRSASRDTIVILDDIFTSVDDQHLERVCGLLASESPNFRQIIMATHLRKIFDWVRSGHLPHNIYDVVELSSRWSIEDGIQARFATFDRKEIENLLNDTFLDRTALAGKTRRLLEALLGDLMITLGARAPMRKYGDYELSDYLGGLQSLVKDGWRVVRAQESHGVLREPHPRESYDLPTKAKEFNDSKNVVNRLVHADERGASYSDKEAREFAREVLGLEAYLRCDEDDCGSLVGTNKRFMTCHCREWKWDKRPLARP